MAQLNNLLVNSTSRFLGKIYASDLELSDLFETNGILNIGKDNPDNAVIYMNDKTAIRGGIDSWLRINDTSAFVTGVYFGSSVVRTDGTLQVGNEGEYLSVNKDAAVIGCDAKFESNVEVFGTIHSPKWEISTVTASGGTLYVCPQIDLSPSAYAYILEVTSTYVKVNILDRSVVTSDSVGGVKWTQNSLVKVSGKIGNTLFNSTNGVLNVITPAIGAMMITLDIPENCKLQANTSVSCSTSDLKVMMYSVGGDKPVGILITSYGENKKSYIDVYSGVTGASVNDPNVRIGLLNGLPSVNGQKVEGWGLYSTNAYLKGTVVSSKGSIGSIELSENGIFSGTKAGEYVGWYRPNEIATNNLSFFAGANNGKGENSSFYVSYGGEMKATKGTIGSFNINDYSIFSNDLYVDTDGNVVNTSLIFQNTSKIDSNKNIYFDYNDLIFRNYTLVNMGNSVLVTSDGQPQRANVLLGTKEIPAGSYIYYVSVDGQSIDDISAWYYIDTYDDSGNIIDTRVVYFSEVSSTTNQYVLNIELNDTRRLSLAFGYTAVDTNSHNIEITFIKKEDAGVNISRDAVLCLKKTIDDRTDIPVYIDKYGNASFTGKLTATTALIGSGNNTIASQNGDIILSGNINASKGTITGARLSGATGSFSGNITAATATIGSGANVLTISNGNINLTGNLNANNGTISGAKINGSSITGSTINSIHSDGYTSIKLESGSLFSQSLNQLMLEEGYHDRYDCCELNAGFLTLYKNYDSSNYTFVTADGVSAGSGTISALAMTADDIYASRIVNVTGYHSYLSLSSNGALVYDEYASGDVRFRYRSSPTADFSYTTISTIVNSITPLISGGLNFGHNHWRLVNDSGAYGVGIASNTLRFRSYQGSSIVDNVINLGTSDSRWVRVYAASATIGTSDIRDKNIIGDIDERYQNMFMNLKPVMFEWKDYKAIDGDNPKVHLGLIAQETEGIANECGITLDELAAVQHDFFDKPLKDGRIDRYGMAYEEIQMLTMVNSQKNTKEIDSLKQKIEELENKITEMIGGK